MASVSQNGFSAGIPSLIHTVTVPGTAQRIPVRIGPTGDLLIWAATRFNREVEPLHVGWCWGYAFREIRGGGALSNHASGTAIDLNAPAHGLGTNPTSNYTAAKIAAIHRIIADTQGALRWGGDYTGRKDGMHFEVVKSEAECARILAIVSGQTVPAPQGGDVQLPAIHEGDGIKSSKDGRGVYHWAVGSAQTLLNIRGLTVPPLVVDGEFGPRTTAAVRELQARWKLPTTGIIDDQTWPFVIWNEAPDYR